MPPIKVMIHTVDAQPATGSPNISLRITIKMIAKKSITVIKIPNHDAIFNGTFEKLIIPSIAYLNNFQKLHLVSPAMRS